MRHYEPCSDWNDAVYDQAKEIGALLGWDIDDIHFSGFGSQGDGACFEGSMRYIKGAAKAVREYAPRDTELHRIADTWQELQRRCFYQAQGGVRQRGRYYHEHCTEFSWDSVPAGLEDSFNDVVRDFMRWIYAALEREYDYQCAWETARACEDLSESMVELRGDARELVRDMRQARKATPDASPSICAALREKLHSLFDQWEDARKERDSIREEFSYWPGDGPRLDIDQFLSTYC